MKKRIQLVAAMLLLFASTLGIVSCSKDSDNETPSTSTEKEIMLLLQRDNSVDLVSINTTTGSTTKKGVVGDLISKPDKNIVLNDAVYINGNPTDWKKQRIYKYNLKDNQVSYNDVSQTMTMAGTYNGSIAVLWWDGSLEKFGLFDPSNGSVKELGVVGDLCWWYTHCFVKDDIVYAFGMMSDQKANFLYKCSLKTGKLIEKIALSSDYAIAGLYNNECIVLSWDGKQENIGSLNLSNGIEKKIGSVGDLETWNRQCTIRGDKLYTLGKNKTATKYIMYVNSLKDGKLLSSVNTDLSSSSPFIVKSAN